MTNIFPIDFEEKLTMAQDDYILFSDSEDGNKIKKAQYKNLKGEKGDTGARINSASFSGNDIVFGETDGNSVTLANAKTTLTGPKGEDGADGQDGAAATITVGTTTTGDAGTSASVTNSGTSSAAVLNFTIPKGDKGDTGSTGSAATITVGSTTTGDAGTSASVVNSGTSSAAVLDFTIPKGDKGDTGSTGATGNGIASITSSKAGKITTVTITETNGNSDSFQISDGADGQGAGDVIGPNSSTDGNVALFDGITGKLIKDSGKTIPTNVSDLNNDSGFITSSSLPGKATSSTTGTVKLGSDTTQSVSANAVSGTASRTYAIQTNSSDQMVVNVPWENTTYESKAAASGGTAVSLVTTGDKYNWNNKADTSIVDNTAYGSSWDGDSTHAPSKDAVYDKLKDLTDNKQDKLVNQNNIKSINGNSLLGSGDLEIAGGHDYSWKTKTGASFKIDLRSYIEPSQNFTVNLPDELEDGMEYVLRCVNGATAYTMTLGTGFTNPRNVSLSLNSYASDQFVFVAINGELELQPEPQLK